MAITSQTLAVTSGPSPNGVRNRTLSMATSCQLSSRDDEVVARRVVVGDPGRRQQGMEGREQGERRRRSTAPASTARRRVAALEGAGPHDHGGQRDADRDHDDDVGALDAGDRQARRAASTHTGHSRRRKRRVASAVKAPTGMSRACGVMKVYCWRNAGTSSTVLAATPTAARVAPNARASSHRHHMLRAAHRMPTSRPARTGSSTSPGLAVSTAAPSPVTRK